MPLHPPRYVLDLMLVEDGCERTVCCGVLDPQTAVAPVGMKLVAMFGPYSASNGMGLIAKNLVDAFPDQFSSLSFALDCLTINHYMNLKRGANMCGRAYPEKTIPDP